MYSLRAFIATLILSLSVAGGISISDSLLASADTIKTEVIPVELRTGVRQKAAFDGPILSSDGELDLFNTSVRAARCATFNDQNNINSFNAQNIANTGARITYTAGNNNNGVNPFQVQATQTTIRVTQTSYNARLGSGPYNDGTPPGWQAMLNQVGGNVNGVHRGHLGPARLGGSGLDVRNIVAMYQRVNTRHLAIWERMVNAAFDNQLVPQPDCIDYRCIAYYTPGRDSPDHIRTTAWLIRNGNRRVWFDVGIPNQPNLPGTAATIHWDDTANMFPSLNHRGRP
ncbi:hypothetical protein FGB62_14g239 [Gracilaria domingensis]|nr:hypothetical protein FGB62_14g239 [Gracilaria domingensis]